MRSALSIFFAFSLLACGGSVVASSDQPVADARSDTPTEASNDAGNDAANEDVQPTIDTWICACLDAELTWALNGGLVAQTDSSSVSPCTTYQHTRTFRDPPGESCTQELPDCSSNLLNEGTLATALGDADVTAAFAAGGLYGRDNRAFDGQVLIVTHGGKSITIGDPCDASTSTCTPIPSGVASLRALLVQLDQQETSRDACGQVFHGK